MKVKLSNYLLVAVLQAMPAVCRGINMDVNNLQAGMSGVAASGMSITCTRSSSNSKSKNGKKSLSYNPKEISSQILRAKKTVGASQALSRARAKLAMLKRAQATGEYDSAELENAIEHAKRMIECADTKVNNLKEEERLRKKAEDKAEREVEKLRNAKRLENLKKRTHRQDENKALFDADTKYYQKEAGNVVGAAVNAASSSISSAAASLELSSASGQMRSLEIAASAMSQAGAQGQAVNVLV